MKRDETEGAGSPQVMHLEIHLLFCLRVFLNSHTHTQPHMPLGHCCTRCSKSLRVAPHHTGLRVGETGCVLQECTTSKLPPLSLEWLHLVPACPPACQYTNICYQRPGLPLICCMTARADINTTQTCFRIRTGQSEGLNGLGLRREQTAGTDWTTKQLHVTPAVYLDTFFAMTTHGGAKKKSGVSVAWGRVCALLLTEGEFEVEHLCACVKRMRFLITTAAVCLLRAAVPLTVVAMHSG